MQVMYRSLRENDRRRYAAVEAAKLGHGGIDYIAALLGCDPKTIRRGQQDLEKLATGPPGHHSQERGPKKGGGASRPPRAYRNCVDFPRRPGEPHRGSPMRQKVIWTDLTPREIGEA